MTQADGTMFHKHQRALQDRFDGRRLADALETKFRVDAFGEWERSIIENAAFFFLATAHEESVDCSFKGGAPGFVRVTGPQTLEWPDYDGNSMYRSIGNILGTPRVGLLFLEMTEAPRRLRVNGTCEIIYGTEGQPKMTLRVTADQIFPNCPRYIPDLAQGTPSPYLPTDGGTGRKPGWKDSPDIAPVLPENDPHRRSDQ